MTDNTNNYIGYKRINHLNEILSEIRERESIDIPDEVFDKIYAYIEKKQIDETDVNIQLIRRILRKLGLRKYYEYAYRIAFKISGINSPALTQEMEDAIKGMFRMVQKPFELFNPGKSFPSYSYVIHKICELLELNDYLQYFPLTKNQIKLKHQDEVWEKICEYLGWEFHESISSGFEETQFNEYDDQSD